MLFLDFKINLRFGDLFLSMKILNRRHESDISVYRAIFSLPSCHNPLKFPYFCGPILLKYANFSDR